MDFRKIMNIVKRVMRDRAAEKLPELTTLYWRLIDDLLHLDRDAVTDTIEAMCLYDRRFDPALNLAAA